MPVIHDTIRINSDLDVYPTHEAKFGKGGYRTVANIAERDNIPFERCEEGMLVTVLEDNTNNNETTTYILKENTRDSKTWEKLFDNLTNRIIALETLGVKIDENALKNYTTKSEFNNMVNELKGLFGQLLQEIQGILNRISGNIQNLQTQIQAINATIADIQARLTALEQREQADMYPKLVATMKFLGYTLPTELKAYRDYNLHADDRLSGDLTISFKPITYAGSYGQAWENVAIYNDLGEKLTAKYATISENGLNIDAIFAKDEVIQMKGDNWEPVPSDYALADGEVRVSITLGAVSYYGVNYGLRMLNNNPSSYNDSFLGANHSYDEWIFTFHNYKPTKFSITNGTHTYGGYGYLTKYELKLSIANWSKTLTYENSNYPNDIEIDFTNLNFGSDTKTIELANAWNIPVTEYDINQDMVNKN